MLTSTTVTAEWKNYANVKRKLFRASHRAFFPSFVCRILLKMFKLITPPQTKLLHVSQYVTLIRKQPWPSLELMPPRFVSQYWNYSRSVLQLWHILGSWDLISKPIYVKSRRGWQNVVLEKENSNNHETRTNIIARSICELQSTE